MKIDNFIEKFKTEFGNNTVENVFTSGYCYHFAIILQNLFGGEIIYYPISNHFATKIGGSIYDITGKLELEEEYYKWEDYKRIEPFETKRIINQCCYKIYEEE